MRVFTFYNCLSLLFLLSCTSSKYLNLKKHNFSRTPKKIIWIQIAGLSEEHIAMNRFNRSNSLKLSSLEKFTCLGKIWNYNLYDLRPSPGLGFLTQITGSKNLTKGCNSFKKDPVWSYLSDSVTPVGVFETGEFGENSLSFSRSCKDSSSSYKDNILIWKMAKSPNKKNKKFHYIDKNVFPKDGVFYDRSCGDKGCYSSFYSNTLSLHKRFSQNKDRYFFMVRDFKYFNALSKNSISEAREILSDIERVIDYFSEYYKHDDNVLFLVSSSGARRFEFPEKGKSWSEFNKEDKNIIFKRNGLQSVVFASGSSAENFCGIYEESDLLQRILWKAPVEKLISPF